MTRQQITMALTVALTVLAAACASALTCALISRPAVGAITSSGDLQMLVISLPHREDRRSRLFSQLGAGADARVIDAVNGKDLAAEPPRFAAQDRPMTRGEVGCFMSHRKAWREIAEGDAECALVLEDDADIRLPEMWPAIKRGLDRVPDDWDILFLGLNWAPEKQKGDAVFSVKGLRKREEGEVWHGCHAMIVRKQAAARLYESSSDAHIKMPVDIWLGHQGLRSYALEPSIIKPWEGSGSDTQGIRQAGGSRQNCSDTKRQRRQRRLYVTLVHLLVCMGTCLCTFVISVLLAKYLRRRQQS